jgi:hypothetical protein
LPQAKPNLSTQLSRLPYFLSTLPRLYNPNKAVSMSDEEQHSPPRLNALNPPPWILHRIALFVFTILPLAFIAITEYLFWSSKRAIGLFDPYGGERRYLFREFVAQFFSLFVLVLLGLFYQALDRAVKIMEPFYHLSTESVGAHSLFVDYVQPSLYFSPFQAIYHSHWAVLCSSLVTVISTNVLPTLALGIFGTDDKSEPMHPSYTHAFTGCLGAITVLMSILLWIVSIRTSCLQEFPESLDAYIELFGGSLYNLFEDARAADNRCDWVSEKLLERAYKNHKFKLILRNDGAPSPYEIQHIPEPQPPLNRFSQFGDWWDKQKAKGFLSRWRGWYRSHVKDCHPTYFQRSPLCLITAVLLIVFVIADGQMFWAPNASFFAVIGEKRFARSTISTVVNTVIWTHLYDDARRMEPFYLLKRDEGALRSDISRQPVWPFQDIFFYLRALKRMKGRQWRDYAMAFILLGNYSANLFHVTWNTLALNGDTTAISFWINYGLHISCECAMIIALVAIFLWRSNPILPQQPVTIASNLSFTYATNILIQDGVQRRRQTLPDGATSSSKSTPEENWADSDALWKFGRFLGPDNENHTGIYFWKLITERDGQIHCNK